MTSKIKVSVIALIVFGLISCAGSPNLNTLNSINKVNITEKTVKKVTSIISMLRSTVRVNKGGSGVVIYKSMNETLILTAWHVVKNLLGEPNFLLGDSHFYNIKPVSVEVRLMSLSGKEIIKKVYYGTIDASSFRHDLALIRIRERLPCTVTPLAKVSPHFGDKVWVIGNPLGVFYYTVTSGVVSHPRRLHNGNYFLQVDAGIIFGNSGGPVFDRFGRLIGIVDAVFFVRGPTHLGIAVPIYTIRSFLHGTDRVEQLLK